MEAQVLLSAMRPVGVEGPADIGVTGVVTDSRQVRPGYAFVAVPGHRGDGRQYVADALQRGAVMIVTEGAVRIVGAAGDVREDAICRAVVADARLAAARAACAFHGHPSRELAMVGVTGTNGKTTTAFLVREALAAAGRKPGLIGTVEYRVGERVIPAGRTTPDAPLLQSLLSQMVGAGCGSCVMEVSSHAVHQKRVAGVEYDAVVFTNLTRDHLDYHGTMEAYFEAKAELFTAPPPPDRLRTAVINVDDPWGARLAARPDVRGRIVTFGTAGPAVVRAENVVLGADGCRFRLRAPWGEADVHSPLMGRFNVSNLLAAIATGGALGLEMGSVLAAVSSAPPAPGRLERVPTRRGFGVFVDYAHTDDALRNVLTTLREITTGRLIVVFGCGGDRDATKRPEMGRVVSELADLAVVTSDNPRSEDPQRIVDQILAGMAATGREVELDREAAIARALSAARPGDLVLIAGKGHETFQEFAHRTVPFDDREVARRILHHG